MALKETLNANFKQLQEENKVNNAYLTGQVSTEKKMFEQVKAMKTSTFDLDKFTVVGSPTISDDGIASGFSLNDYLTTNVDLSQANNWEIKSNFIYNKPSSTTSSGEYIKVFKAGTDKVSGLYFTVNANSKQCRLTFTGLTAQTISFTKLNNGDKIETITTFDGSKYTAVLRNVTQNETRTLTISTTEKVIGSGVEIARSSFVSFANNNIVDLKQFSITIDGKEVFNGNKTGVDTIGDIEIPYTLSKTGSKIVDAVYRDRVQDVYEQFGQANYYTLGEIDFSLPMGEIYGMKADKSEIDGQWVASYRQLANNVEWKTNTPVATYDLSDYLPNDNNIYEVLVGAEAFPDASTVKKYISIELRTDILTVNNVTMCSGRTQIVNIENPAYNTAPLLVGTGRYIRQYTSTSANAGGTYSLYLYAYRKVR